MVYLSVLIPVICGTVITITKTVFVESPLNNTHRLNAAPLANLSKSLNFSNASISYPNLIWAHNSSSLVRFTFNHSLASISSPSSLTWYPSSTLFTTSEVITSLSNILDEFGEGHFVLGNSPGIEDINFDNSIDNTTENNTNTTKDDTNNQDNSNETGDDEGDEEEEDEDDYYEDLEIITEITKYTSLSSKSYNSITAGGNYTTRSNNNLKSDIFSPSQSNTTVLTSELTVIKTLLLTPITYFELIASFEPSSPIISQVSTSDRYTLLSLFLSESSSLIDDRVSSKRSIIEPIKSYIKVIYSRDENLRQVSQTTNQEGQSTTFTLIENRDSVTTNTLNDNVIGKSSALSSSETYSELTSSVLPIGKTKSNSKSKSRSSRDKTTSKITTATSQNRMKLTSTSTSTSTTPLFSLHSLSLELTKTFSLVNHNHTLKYLNTAVLWKTSPGVILFILLSL